jgi:hypothetical protein
VRALDDPRLPIRHAILLHLIPYSETMVNEYDGPNEMCKGGIAKATGYSENAVRTTLYGLANEGMVDSIRSRPRGLEKLQPKMNLYFLTEKGKEHANQVRGFVLAPRPPAPPRYGGKRGKYRIVNDAVDKLPDRFTLSELHTMVKDTDGGRTRRQVSNLLHRSGRARVVLWEKACETGTGHPETYYEKVSA